jgi:hypothetical protein
MSRLASVVCDELDSVLKWSVLSFCSLLEDAQSLGGMKYAVETVTGRRERQGTVDGITRKENVSYNLGWKVLEMHIGGCVCAWRLM